MYTHTHTHTHTYPHPHTPTHTHTHTHVYVRASRYGVRHSKRRWTSLQLKDHKVGDQQLCMAWKMLLPVYSELKHLNTQVNRLKRTLLKYTVEKTDLEELH